MKTELRSGQCSGAARAMLGELIFHDCCKRFRIEAGAAD